jgi:hypothetical protein
MASGARTSANRLRFALEGPVGVRVVLEVSPDLLGWVPVAINVLPGALELETEGCEAVPTGFYRTLVLP